MPNDMATLLATFLRVRNSRTQALIAECFLSTAFEMSSVASAVDPANGRSSFVLPPASPAVLRGPEPASAVFFGTLALAGEPPEAPKAQVGARDTIVATERVQAEASRTMFDLSRSHGRRLPETRRAYHDDREPRSTQVRSQPEARRSRVMCRRSQSRARSN